SSSRGEPPALQRKPTTLPKEARIEAKRKSRKQIKNNKKLSKSTNISLGQSSENGDTITPI
ncbi:hypothetical protein, partial [Flavobacterium bomense]